MEYFRTGTATIGVYLLLVVAFASSALGECDITFRRGDSNQDGDVDLSDGISTLNQLFMGAGTLGCLDAADSDDSGSVDITDAIFTFSFLFLGGRPPPDPGYRACGPDPTSDSLDCVSYEPCAAMVACDVGDCCPEGHYCAKSKGDCDGKGECKKRPDLCPKIRMPVCGCDGTTYGNDCLAAAAGVNVAYAGEELPNPNLVRCGHLQRPLVSVQAVARTLPLSWRKDGSLMNVARSSET